MRYGVIVFQFVLFFDTTCVQVPEYFCVWPRNACFWIISLMMYLKWKLSQSLHLNFPVSELLQDSLLESAQPNLDFIRCKPSSTKTLSPKIRPDSHCQLVNLKLMFALCEAKCQLGDMVLYILLLWHVDRDSLS